MKTKTKLIVALATVVVLLAGFSGVAYAADGAAPGDTLYGLDCALEHVGIGDGGLQERLTEATHLAECGQVEDGLNHAALSIASRLGLGEGSQANAALITAANAVQTTNQGESNEIRARVAEMLRWMATTETQGEEYGQGVTERAREISATCEQNHNGTPDGAPDGTQNQEQEQNGALNQNGELNQNGAAGAAR